MAQPGQMFDNAIYAIKGEHINKLDFAAKLSANVTFTPPPGRAFHLNSSGELETGVARHWMGLFAFQGGDSLDVDSSTGAWYPVGPTGKFSCFVAKGDYELVTTEFDTARSYAPNDPLRAVVANTTLATGGRLTNESVTMASQTDTPETSSTAVCGIVSRGVATNAYGKTTLSFWPVWYPGRSDE